MDSEQFDDGRFATATDVADDVYDYSTSMPISTFDDIDTAKNNWGVSFGEMLISELDDVQSYTSSYFVEDVYGYDIDVTDRFDLADEAAQNGDVVYNINLAEATVEPVVYNGKEQKPAVTLTMNGEELIESEDYKVIYLGYVQPGEAYLAVCGLGDYIGTAYIPFTISREELLGDVDGDGAVTSLDATFIQRFLAVMDMPDSFNETAADIDGDGDVTSVDVTYIQRYLALIEVPYDIGEPIT